MLTVLGLLVMVSLVFLLTAGDAFSRMVKVFELRFVERRVPTPKLARLCRG